VRSSGRDVSNLYARLVLFECQHSRIVENPLESASSFLQLAILTIGTLVAKEKSEQEGYKE
jgi:hypothetical protein